MTMANEPTPVIPMTSSAQALNIGSLTNRFSKAVVARNKATAAFAAATAAYAAAAAAMQAANSEFNEAACLLNDVLGGNPPPVLEEGCQQLENSLEQKPSVQKGA
jgi:hypothetical protein